MFRFIFAMLLAAFSALAGAEETCCRLIEAALTPYIGRSSTSAFEHAKKIGMHPAKLYISHPTGRNDIVFYGFNACRPYSADFKIIPVDVTIEVSIISRRVKSIDCADDTPDAPNPYYINPGTSAEISTQ